MISQLRKVFLMSFKPTLYNYSQSKFITKIDSPDLIEKYVVIENEGLEPDKLIAKKYDVIEIAPNDFEVFRPLVAAVDWKTNQLGMADCLVLQKNGKYRPIHLMSVTIIELIKKNRLKINSQLPVIVIGEYHFVYGVVVQLALSGFVEIIISLTDSDPAFSDLIQTKIKSFIFDLNIRLVNINELTTSEIVGALLISDFKKEINLDAYELLTYFNFLSQGAIFIDCNSVESPSLVEDARKAEIAVIDEGQVISQKYNYLLEILKISS